MEASLTQVCLTCDAARCAGLVAFRALDLPLCRRVIIQVSSRFVAFLKYLEGGCLREHLGEI